ncbi:MAG TPA: isocitrate/isopropylmalate dehydrogenase family protein [Anaerolineaceae bacterium]
MSDAVEPPTRICLLPGDGIGPEVVEQGARVLEALRLPLEFTRAEVGYGAYQKTGSPLPEETIAAIRGSRAALFGAVTTPPNIPGYFSPVIRMRRTFDLYANLRPCRSIPHPISRPEISMLIVRENTEDLYAGIERVEENGERAVGEMVITRRASARIARKAFQLARENGVHQVTIVHKANVLRETCGLFLRTALEVAAEFPEITAREMLVDTCAMELVRDPAQFEVIVTTNMFGDILSDEASMLVGGLGMACSGNIGEEAAIFEPVHGSAPGLVGTHSANPMATILSAAMLLDFIGCPEQAQRVRAAVDVLLRERLVTPDLGGSLSTSQVTDMLIERL